MHVTNNDFYWASCLMKAGVVDSISHCPSYSPANVPTTHDEKLDYYLNSAVSHCDCCNLRWDEKNRGSLLIGIGA